MTAEPLDVLAAAREQIRAIDDDEGLLARLASAGAQLGRARQQAELIDDAGERDALRAEVDVLAGAVGARAAELAGHLCAWERATDVPDRQLSSEHEWAILEALQRAQRTASAGDVDRLLAAARDCARAAAQAERAAHDLADEVARAADRTLEAREADPADEAWDRPPQTRTPVSAGLWDDDVPHADDDGEDLLP